MRVLFLDRACREPYDSQRLAARGLGGSEASCTRNARSLSRWHEVRVAQGCRTAETVESPSLSFVPLASIGTGEGSRPDVIVVMRRPDIVRSVRRQFPDSKLVLWLKDYLPFLPLHRASIVESGCTVVCVSRSHRDITARAFDRGLRHLIRRRSGSLAPMDIRFIYNPIADDLRPDDTPIDRNKLVFFSSPHKGLDQVLAVFGRARTRLPALTLCVANPGYVPMLFRIHQRVLTKVFPSYQGHLAQEGVRVLGSLAHEDVMRHVREACCVLYTQHKFAETFGHFFAEANAVGTPVLAHDFGSAAEVLSSPEQVLDVRDEAATIERLVGWCSGGRPVVRMREEFRLSRVTQDWLALFEELTGRSAVRASG